MASNPKHPPGPAMTLGNMRELGVKRLLASCLNDACRHQGLTDVSGYPADTEAPWFRSRVKCAMCGRLRVGKENLHVALLVGAAMCSACWCGSHDRWP